MSAPSPWLLLAQAGLTANKHWKTLPVGDRERIAQLLKKSKGLPANLTPREREELRLLLGRLEVGSLARELVPFALKARRGKRR
ncbi:hypothetical protein GKE82_00255 [Conexibacter sp. W3-3-2]|uniref:hypothetical protein n=1 Tax=Conexibacter sp. W3-3-2 TaxID=2675227 RepID=UPI0012B98723|nr:hypothetical protein [Conexibacter sp. W3-3-2]MTD42775.1 hypothetical protein [Conexibacter sp. W3-3-2]